jgi:hypothetical protein
LVFQFAVAQESGAPPASFLSAPVQRWAFDLKTTIGRGNNVVPSADGRLVVATAADGTLHFLRTDEKEKSRHVVFVPPEASPSSDATEATNSTLRTVCRTGATLVEDDNGGFLYAVYSVTDEAFTVSTGYEGYTDDSYQGGQPTPTETVVSARSRVIAVNLKGKALWSISLDGTVVGSPYVSQTLAREKVYVAHNIPVAVSTTLDDGSIASAVTVNGSGRVSVIFVPRTSTDEDSASLVASVGWNNNEQFNPDSEISPIPFGPLAGRSLTLTGSDDPVDIMYFGAVRDGDNIFSGALFMMIPSAAFEENKGKTAASYTILAVNAEDSPPYSAASKPAVSAKGTSIYLGQASSRVDGWTAISDGSLNIEELAAQPRSIFLPQWDRTIDQQNGDGEARKYCEILIAFFCRQAVLNLDLTCNVCLQPFSLAPCCHLRATCYFYLLPMDPSLPLLLTLEGYRGEQHWRHLFSRIQFFLNQKRKAVSLISLM